MFFRKESIFRENLKIRFSESGVARQFFKEGKERLTSKINILSRFLSQVKYRIFFIIRLIKNKNLKKVFFEKKLQKIVSGGHIFLTVDLVFP